MLLLSEQPLLSKLPENVTLVEDLPGEGAFLRFHAEKPLSRHVFSLGELEGIARFTACHRYEPFWMEAVTGTRGGEVPVETQFLLAERPDGTCVLFAPMLDGPFRTALQGTEETGLELIAETGDPAVVGDALAGLFVMAGPNPYALVEAAAKRVMARMQTGRLRRDKRLPRFADYFGWCTWDAFYQEVSEEKVREGLESFAAGGIRPKLLILDDGWQSVEKQISGEQRLTAFSANGKFPNDLAPTVRMAKEEFGVEQFLVWHALNGYWGGVDGESLPGYGVRSVKRASSEGILHYRPTLDSWWGGVVGLVSPEHIYKFYQDYHRHLRLQGVDGVKVDSQATLEGVAAGAGGRIALMRAYHEALEGSAQTHFKGELINCMSCASEMLYGALNSTITRTSTDFWPNRPESHGLHLYVNAQVSLWFGALVHPDWDMFQLGHAMGAYHAAGRAVSGSPIYVSDKPGQHNFDLLRKLVFPNGKAARASQPGRPTRDCLFHNPTKENVLLKIFNVQEISSMPNTGLIGVFNARYDEKGTEPISGSVSPSDVEGLQGEQFAVYAHHANELRVLNSTDRWDLTLAQLDCEVFTFVPIQDGFAPIGLTGMFHSAGALIGQTRSEDRLEILLRSGGAFTAWSETAPLQIETETGETLAFAYSPDTRRLDVTAPGEGATTLILIVSTT